MDDRMKVMLRNASYMVSNDLQNALATPKSRLQTRESFP